MANLEFPWLEGPFTAAEAVPDVVIERPSLPVQGTRVVGRIGLSDFDWVVIDAGDNRQTPAKPVVLAPPATRRQPTVQETMDRYGTPVVDPFTQHRRGER